MVFLGSDDFMQQLPQQDEGLKEVPRVQRHAARPKLEEIFGANSPDEAIAAAYREHGYTREIAGILGVNYATVSRRLCKDKVCEIKRC